MRLDVLIAGGTVYDGSGSPGLRADVGTVGDRIAMVGDLTGSEARRVIDASGLAVCPGFIDPHTHCHVDVGKFGTADAEDDTMHCDNLLRQGITTVIAGNCGSSAWPIGEHLDRVDREGFKSNYATLVGHHTVRARAMAGSDNVFPDHEQTLAIQSMVREALAEGAFGVTVGYARRQETIEEILDFTRPAAEAGTIYASHVRSEGEGLLQALSEIIEVGWETGIAVQVSHLKTDGPAHWGKMDMALQLLEGAAEAGVDVAADRYPYVGWHGGSTNVMPLWCYELARERGGKAHLLDGDVADRFREAVDQQFARFGGPDKLMFVALRQRVPEVDGRTAAQLMGQWGLELAETALEIERISDEQGPISAMGFSMCEDNLRRVLSHPLVMVGTDGHLEVFGKTATHPRNYGTYPRVLGRYVREEGLLTLPEAVRKMTSLPAERFGIRDRGSLRAGYFADIAVFDPATVADNATFTDAHHYPSGMPYVLVNGNVAVDNDRTAVGHFGRALRRAG